MAYAPPRSRPPRHSAPPVAEDIAPSGAVASSARRAAAWRRPDPWRLAPVLLAAALAGAYLVLEPRTPDLAGHIARAELFGREGLAIWNGGWYGGHHTLSYSVLAPPLSWLLGPQLMGALAAVGAAACFEPLAHRHFGAMAARWGTLWFAAGITTNLFTNRLPFALGIAFGIGALLALQRGRPRLAALLALGCGLSSPVAGVFAAMAGTAYALAARGDRARSQRVRGGGLALAAIGPPVAIAVAFPDPGYAPFETQFWIPVALLGLAAIVLLPARERTLRIGAALYVVGATVALLIPTQMGITTIRLGALVGGPVLLCALWPRIRGRTAIPIVAVLAALAVWQWSAPVRDTLKWVEDPVAQASYFDPLREYLRLELPDQRRIEIPFTYGHWEGAEMASDAALARGGLRQLDTGRNPIFYEGALNSATYANWLSDNAVRYVALPDAKPDQSSYTEHALIVKGLPYLKLRRQFDHWKIYEVTLPTPIVIPQGDANIVLDQLGSDELLLRVKRPGDATVKVRWSPYWLAKGGCVERQGDWIKISAEREGFLRLVTSFSPERVFQRGRRCNGV